MLAAFSEMSVAELRESRVHRLASFLVGVVDVGSVHLMLDTLRAGNRGDVLGRTHSHSLTMILVPQKVRSFVIINVNFMLSSNLFCCVISLSLNLLLRLWTDKCVWFCRYYH